MIASLFYNSKPINYILFLLTLLLVSFSMYFATVPAYQSYISLLQGGLCIVLHITLLFVLQSVARQQKLIRDNNYVPLIYLLLLLLFPSTLLHFKLVISHFFVVLGFIRLLKLQSSQYAKPAIFDATIWFLLAAYFQFWTLLFVPFLFIGIIFHASNDYKNWLVPLVALVCLYSIYTALSLYIPFISINWQQVSQISFDYSQFESTSQHVALGIYAAIVFLFVSSQALQYTSKPLNLHNTYKKIYIGLFLALPLYLIAAPKSNALLIYSFFPMCILGTNFLEDMDKKWVRELFLIPLTLLILGLFAWNYSSLYA